MPREFKFNVGGTWKDPVQGHVKVNVASVWKEVIQIYANVAGTWKEILYKVTLSGETIQDGVLDPANATAGIRFNTDGTIDKLVGVTYTQIDSATDWIIPNGQASIDFDVRFTAPTGTWTSEAAAVNTWIDLGTNREWYVQQTSPGTNSITCTFEIRDKAGTTVGSGVYLCDATVDI
jgi:hypothetical protein